MTITTEADYETALNRVCYELWNAPEGTPECCELDALADEIVEYEEIHYPMSSMTSELTLKYVPLSKLDYWEQNPKLHDIGAISASITKHGFRDPLGWDCQLNGGEGGIVEGNGRLETLAKMKQQGQPAPRGILEADGDY